MMRLGDIALFIAISSIESISILVFIFTVFRFEYRYLKYHMAFIALALSFVSYSMRAENLSIFNPFVQLALLIVLIWLLFRVHLLHAVIMGAVGYLSYGLIQGIIVYFVGRLEHDPQWVTDVSEITLIMHVVGLLSAGVTFGISFLLKYWNLGFAFIPSVESPRRNVKLKDNAAFLLTILISVIGVGITYILIMMKTDPVYLFLFILIMVVSLSILLYLTTEKERKFFS